MIEVSVQSLSEQPLTESADIDTASDDYKTRFSGVAGRWMLQVQEKILLKILAAHPKSSVLDVGGGHGQIAGPLSANGFKVTVIASSPRGFTQLSNMPVEVKTGNLLDLPFDGKEFPIVTSFRLLPHSINWRRLIAELCRVSSHSVIIDFPTSNGINGLTPYLFGLKKHVEKNTRTYQSFLLNDIEAEFKENGFTLVSVTRQFFFPMVLHRVLKSQKASTFIELIPRLFGLTSRFGSPIIVEARRCL